MTRRESTAYWGVKFDGDSNIYPIGSGLTEADARRVAKAGSIDGRQGRAVLLVPRIILDAAEALRNRGFHATADRLLAVWQMDDGTDQHVTRG